MTGVWCHRVDRSFELVLVMWQPNCKQTWKGAAATQQFIFSFEEKKLYSAWLIVVLFNFWWNGNIISVHRHSCLFVCDVYLLLLVVGSFLFVEGCEKFNTTVTVCFLFLDMWENKPLWVPVFPKFEPQPSYGYHQ